MSLTRTLLANGASESIGTCNDFGTPLHWPISTPDPEFIPGSGLLLSQMSPADHEVVSNRVCEILKLFLEFMTDVGLLVDRHVFIQSFKMN